MPLCIHGRREPSGPAAVVHWRCAHMREGEVEGLLLYCGCLLQQLRTSHLRCHCRLGFPTQLAALLCREHTHAHPALQPGATGIGSFELSVVSLVCCPTIVLQGHERQQHNFACFSRLAWSPLLDIVLLNSTCRALLAPRSVLLWVYGLHVQVWFLVEECSCEGRSQYMHGSTGFVVCRKACLATLVLPQCYIVRFFSQGHHRPLA